MEEKDLSQPRIGVFVCHCGINIGAYVNVPDVVEYDLQVKKVLFYSQNSPASLATIKRLL